MSRSLIPTSTRYVAALGVAAAVQLVAATATAHPVCDQRTCAEAVVHTRAVVVDQHTDPYAEPLSALGGRTLAQVLSDHVDQVLGPFPV